MYKHERVGSCNSCRRVGVINDEYERHDPESEYIPVDAVHVRQANHARHATYSNVDQVPKTLGLGLKREDGKSKVQERYIQEWRCWWCWWWS